MAVGLKLCSDDSKLFEEPTVYRNTIGALQHLLMTRPDQSYVGNKLSQFLKSPTRLQWQACKRILRYVKGTLDYGIMFKPAPVLAVEAYADADWAGNLNYRRSTSGFCVFFGGNLIQWASRKRKVVALSSTEHRSLSQVSTALAWIRSLLTEIRVQLINKSVVW